MLDVTPIISAVASQIWYLIPIGIFGVIIQSAWFKGYMGELMVRLATKVLLDSKTYHVIHNVTLPCDDGSTQIDHVIVSRHGVFVVETKNMRGWIFGSEKQKTWTQKIFKKNYKFQNPLHQNYKHTKTLAHALAIDETLLISVVVFVGNNTFKTSMPENVTYSGGLIRFIKRHKEVLIDDESIQYIIRTIESGRLKPSLKTDRQHVKDLKARHEKKPLKSQEEDTRSCPKCGSAMVKRVAKKGSNAGNEFWGCSTFPKCRAVVQEEESASPQNSM